jgi:hypothetical protein
MKCEIVEKLIKTIFSRHLVVECHPLVISFFYWTLSSSNLWSEPKIQQFVTVKFEFLYKP